ncbi:dihydrolipoyl dehydrogenase, partial [Cribrihabitans sp. XS_ASV171]
AHGVCHIHATGAEGRLSGAALCAPGAEHLAHLLAWAIQCGLTATEALDLPFYHPTLAEGLQTALRQICAQTGQEGPWQRDDDPLPGDLQSGS